MVRSFFRRSTHAAPLGTASTWHDAADRQASEEQQEKNRVLEEAYEEYCRLREAGQQVPASEFCGRYPTYRKSLRRLIDVHDNLEQHPALVHDLWPAVGDEFLGFRILQQLGAGAIARVYLASEGALGGRYVAIKVSPFGDDEALTLGKLSHPNVVPVHSVQVDAETGMTAVCMPFLGHATLADVLDLAFAASKPPPRADVILAAAGEHARLSSLTDRTLGSSQRDPVLAKGTYVDGVGHLGIQLAQALAYTHQQGILHRDLKPSNVLLTPHGRPMLLDFNLSCDVQSDVSRVGGTLPYMPPEQIRETHLQSQGEDAAGDPRCDLFSLGVILYELLAGRLPFGDPPQGLPPREAASRYLEAQRQRPLPLAELNREVDAALAETIERCLALDPAQRPASAEELAMQLQRRFSAGQRLRRWCRRRRRPLAVAVACLGIAALGLGWRLATLPPYAVRQYQYGVADFQRGRLPSALEHFDRSLAADPNSARSLFARGVTYQELGEYQRSITDLGAAGKKYHHGIVHECLAYSLFKSGQPRAAAAVYELATREDPSSAELCFKRACALWRSGQPGAAETALGKAIEKDAHFQLAYQLRAQIRLSMLHQGEASIRQAIEDLRKAMSIGPSSAALELSAARAYAAAAEKDTQWETRVAQHLDAAVARGCPRTLIDRDSLLARFRDRSWFRHLLARAGASPASAHPQQAEGYLMAPDRSAILGLLGAQRGG